MVAVLDTVWSVQTLRPAIHCRLFYDRCDQKVGRVQFGPFGVFCSFCIKQTVSFTESDNEATKKIKEEAILDYSSENTRDESLLQELYDIYFPGSGSEPQRNLITSQWESIGFQTSNPRLDFRGGGVISIKHLLNFEKALPSCARRDARAGRRTEVDARRHIDQGHSLHDQLLRLQGRTVLLESWKQLSLGAKRKFKNLANFLKRFR
jgi:hypothetical protein